MIIPAFQPKPKFVKKSTCSQFYMHSQTSCAVCTLCPAITLPALQNGITCQQTGSFTADSVSRHRLLPRPGLARAALAKRCCRRHLPHSRSWSVLTITSPCAAAGAGTARRIFQRQCAIVPVPCLLLGTTLTDTRLYCLEKASELPDI